MLKLNRFSYEEIKIGDTVSFKKTVDADLVKKFAEVSEDFSPLHVDSSYGKTSQFGGNIAHGALLGSFFSALVGMLCPGEKALYLSQNLNFKRPLLVGSEVLVEGVVVSKSDVTKTIVLTTRVRNKVGGVIVDGTALVKVRE